MPTCANNTEQSSWRKVRQNVLETVSWCQVSFYVLIGYRVWTVITMWYWKFQRGSCCTKSFHSRLSYVVQVVLGWMQQLVGSFQRGTEEYVREKKAEANSRWCPSLKNGPRLWSWRTWWTKRGSISWLCPSQKRLRPIFHRWSRTWWFLSPNQYHSQRYLLDAVSSCSKHASASRFQQSQHRSQ